MKRVRIMLSGEIARAVTVDDIKIAVTKGAKAAIEAAGGKIVVGEEEPAKKKTGKAKATKESVEAEEPASTDSADEDPSGIAE